MAKKELLKYEEKELNIDEIKLEVFDFAKSQINIEIDKEIKKANDRYIKDRNRKILSQKIIIFLLVISYLITIGFLINDHYFDKYLVNDSKVDNKINNNNNSNPSNKDENTINEPSIDENELKKEKLINKYSTIFDNYKLTIGNEYLNSNDINRFLLAYSIDNISDDSFIIEEDTYMIKKEIISDKVYEMFNTKIDDETFKYNDIEFKYFNSLGYYILDKKFVRSDISIIRKIIDVDEESSIKIITKDYYLNDNLVYTVENKYLCKLEDLEDKLDLIPSKTNIFEKNNDGFYLKVE